MTQHPVSESLVYPIVFVSSTEMDLRPFRVQVREAALTEGLLPRDMKYWSAKDVHKPLPECMVQITGDGDQVPPSNVVVVVVAHRYGWVPPEEENAEQHSITWLECLQAERDDQEVLAFVLDDDQDWPEELKEDYRIMQAVRGGTTPADIATIAEDVRRKQERLQQFKHWLQNRAICNKFTTPDDLFNKVRKALADWKARHPEFQVRPSVDNPKEYLRLLYEECSHIDIRGLQVGSGRATRFGIDELYIPLTMIGHAERDADMMGRLDRHIELDEALQHPRVVIIGDPGAGKTTFLRRIAYLLCLTHRGLDPNAAAERLKLPKCPMPFFVRVGELCEHIGKTRKDKRGPASEQAAEWLVDFLAAASAEHHWGLSKAFFQQHLEDGTAIVLLDGLDEAPTERERKQISAIVQKASGTFAKTQFVVTSRPAAYDGEVVLPEYTEVRIENLEDKAVEEFLHRWCEHLFPESAEQAEKHLQELRDGLAGSVDIRRLARNPVMLTALAVVHWNEKRIPQQRADLYESIIKWLAQARERKTGREPPERCVNLLQELALYMQNHQDGRQIQIPRREAAEALAANWREVPEDERVAAAEAFLRDDELDSGIIVGRGSHVRFWHLTFQEYLAARALAARSDKRQSELLLQQPAKLFEAEWREPLLLLAGVLYHNGVQKVDRFFKEILDGFVAVHGTKTNLANAAACAGLLGAVVHDLAPMQYKPSDKRYHRIFDKVMGIFDAERSKNITIKTRIAAADALGRAGDPRFLPAARAQNWITIPACSFVMKSTGNQVELDEYRVARYPVTVAEYDEFVEEDGYKDERWWSAGGFGKFTQPEEWDEQKQFPTRPVVYVSWFEAAAYASWRSNGHVTYRLLTEAEWERAAGGVEGREYPWGKEEPDETRCNFAMNVKHTTPVGLYPQGMTPEGIGEMGGNVWEWCIDWYHEKPPGGKNPVATEEASSRVLRGGSWYDPAADVRVAFRGRGEPGARSSRVGFRLALVQSRS